MLLAIDNSVSGYNRSSLLSRFNSGETIAPDLIFRELYDVSYRFYEFTGGAFDVAAGPLFDAWGFGFKGNGFPDDGRDAICLDKTSNGLCLVLFQTKPIGYLLQSGKSSRTLSQFRQALSTAQSYGCSAGRVSLIVKRASRLQLVVSWAECVKRDWCHCYRFG